MPIKEVHPSRLHDRAERAQAKLARIARCDVQFGKTRALVLAKRAEKMRVDFDADLVVARAYASHIGHAWDHLAYECPECGTAVMGRARAAAHCFEFEEEQQ